MKTDRLGVFTGRTGHSGQAGRSGQSGQTGLTLVEMTVILVLVAIVAAIAVAAYRSFVNEAREAAVVSLIHNIMKGQELYRLKSDDETYTGDFSDIEERGFIDAAPGSATRVYHDYSFNLAVGSDDGGSTWSVFAVPTGGGGSVRWFYADEGGGIHYEVGSAADQESPFID